MKHEQIAHEIYWAMEHGELSKVDSIIENLTNNHKNMKTNTPKDEAEETRRGKLIAEVLNLKHTREYPDRYNTEWGTKTDLGLYRIMKRIVIDGE